MAVDMIARAMACGENDTVLYTAQTLTAEQKAQARTNIGAGTSSFDGTYNSLTGKPTIPSKTSELQNDSGYLTQHQSLAAYRTSAAQDVIDNAKYSKPATGIPSTDMTSAVQESLAKADTALQSHQDISGKENTSNKVTSLSSASTDTEYPSAKCVYDELEGKQATALTSTVTIAVADWNGTTTCTKSVTGVTASNVVFCDSSDSSVQCTAQGAGTLTFTADATPTEDITVKVVILP